MSTGSTCQPTSTGAVKITEVIDHIGDCYILSGGMESGVYQSGRPVRCVISMATRHVVPSSRGM